MYCNEYGINCNNANSNGYCRLTACTNWNTKIRIDNSPISIVVEDTFSLIKWNTDFTNVPVETDLLVIIKDDRGDRPDYYTTVAWVVLKDVKTKPIWISNNEQIFDEVIMWAKLPAYDDIKRF